MAVFLEEKPEGLTGFIDFRSSRFSKSRIDEILARYENLLLKFGDDPDRALEEPPSRGRDPLPVTNAPGDGIASGPSCRGTAEINHAAASGLGMPRNELERRLIAIWQEFFPARQIGRDSDFFELGGHSLLAAALFSRIGDSLGKDLPLALLLRAPTIAAMSSLLDQEGFTPSWSSLVPINTEGSRPPLFLVHAGGGNIISYRLLSRHLVLTDPSGDCRRKVFGLLRSPHTGLRASRRATWKPSVPNNRADPFISEATPRAP